MIAYKVVGKRHRYGSNLTGYFYENYVENTTKKSPILKCLKKSIENYVEKFDEFFPQYKKDKILTAPKETIGFLCFKDKIYAKNFQVYYDQLYRNTVIIRVEVLKMKSNQPKTVYSGGMSIERLIDKIVHKKRKSMNVPEGTIFVDTLKVLD